MQEVNPVPTSEVITPVAVEQPKQSNFLTILLSILLFISVLIAGFFAFQTQKLVAELRIMKDEVQIVPTATTEPTNEPVTTNSASATADPTANWKTYTNTKYGFSFKYPSDTKLMGDINGLTFTLINNNKVVTVIIGNNSQKSSVNDYFLSQISPNDPQSIAKYISFIDSKIGDNNFVIATQDSVYFKSQTTGLFNYLISTNTNYIVNFNTSSSGSVKSDNSLISQILSTFKFLD